MSKDFSTLGLQISTDMWKKAGLTEADSRNLGPARGGGKKLTTGGSPARIQQHPRPVDAFMRQAGGSLLNADGTAFTADSRRT